jgi:four helix bundle protein
MESAHVQDFRNLKVWEKGHALTLATYKETADFPSHELFGLRLQMRRTAATIPMKIADSCGRTVDADVSRSLQTSMGSASELEYQYVLAHDLGYVSSERFDRLTADVVEVKKMLVSFIKTVRG